MSSHALTILLLLPLVGAAFACAFPKRQIGPIAALVTLVQVGYVLPLLWRFDTTAALQQGIDKVWVKDLGIHYALGLDGLNIFLVALCIVTWSIATFAASRRQLDQPRLFYVLMAVAEAATIGAFVAQDVILFALFFDLLLIPFYLLIGMWGGENRRAATAKFMIYTLAGSFVMFAAAIALGVISAQQNGTPLSFAFVDLLHAPITGGAQNWIFLGFAVAFVIKMPLPPLHGWMPDTYKSAPLAVLIPLSAVVAKLGTYGFLRIVLPQLPAAAVHFQTLMLVLAVVAILYGSVMAFTADHVRMVVGYSSIAQIGFITLGIFSLNNKGIEGSLIQMVTHGLVVIPAFLICGYLAERAGSNSLSKMGGLAKRAPIFATIFLVVSFITLALPGSPNFVGEYYILFGAFDHAFTYGVIALAGVVLASVYMIRFLQMSMHNRGTTTGDENPHSRELSAGEIGVLVPAVLITLALAVYPQFMVDKIAPSASQALMQTNIPHQTVFVPPPITRPQVTQR